MVDLPLAILLENMHKKFGINQSKIKGGCQSERKVVTHNSKSDLRLVEWKNEKEQKLKTQQHAYNEALEVEADVNRSVKFR